MKVIQVAPISFAKASKRTNDLCNQINHLYREGYSTQQIAEKLNIGKTAVRYYYYGVHNCSEAQSHWKNAFNANKEVGYVQYSLNQVRVGTCVPIG
jgi:orotate phosphoribosyltransferase-like protein